MTRRIFIMLLVMLYFALPAAAEDGPDFIQLYESGSKAYFEKNYAEARDRYETLLKKYGDNGHAHFNLGNAHYKMGNLGLALQHYEKARLLIPRFGDLNVNLEKARSGLTDQVEQSLSGYIAHTFYFWSAWLNAAEYRWLLALVSLVFWAGCGVAVLRRKSVVSVARVLFFLVYAYAGFGYYLKNEQERAGSHAVVLRSEIGVRANYLDKDKPLFQLHEGTKVRVIDVQSFGEGQKWYRISLPQGQTGWVLAGDVGLI